MYFKSLFSSNKNQNLAAKINFDYNKHSMDSVIEYIYSGIIDISEDNFERIMDISTNLKVLINYCIINKLDKYQKYIND